MKKMKVLSILSLAFLLVLSACGGGGKGSEGSPSADNSASASAPPSSAAPETQSASPSAAEPEAVDLGGRVIKISAWWDGTPKGDTAGSKAQLDKYAELEKKYNMKLEFVNVPWGEYWDKWTTSVLAGEPMADITIMEVKRGIVPAKQGLILPLSEFTKDTSDINNDQKRVVKLPGFLGSEYAFGTPFVSVVGLYYNRDLFKQLGLPDPQELYNAGQWNWDKFLEVAKQATRDTDNDGKNDTFGYAGWAADAARHFGVSNGALFVNEDLTLGMTDPKMIEALEFTSRLYNTENVVEVKTGNKMDYNETNTFKDGHAAMSINYDWNMGDVKFEIGVVPVPAGPNSDGKHTYANAALNGYFIPKGVKDPQIVFQIFEEMQDLPVTEEYAGQDWLESRFKNEADIKMALEHIHNTGRLAVEEVIPDFPFYQMMDEIFKNNASVSATIEANKQKAQAALDKVNN